MQAAQQVESSVARAAESSVAGYIDLIAERPLVWSLFALYLAVTSYLAWLGHRRTGDIQSYAIGGGAMSPWVVGVTLAASIASSATFIINPGFVYVHGLAAFLHFGGSVLIGIILGLVIMSIGFRRIGAKNAALTLPQWVAQRFGSRGLGVFFAAINLLSLAFVVLIIGGISIVMQRTLGLSNTESLVVVVVFVFGYVFIGGTYAHAYTNTLQGIVMVAVSVVIVASGLHYIGAGPGDYRGLFAEIAASNPSLMAPINPQSPLFGSFFSVYVSGFVIGFALVCQPHIMTKALYVKTDRDVRRYLAVAIAVSLVFTALLLVGFYAHVAGIPTAALLGADGALRQDLVMTAYLEHTFSPGVMAVIAVALLAAGMSTLDGILVALSSIAGNDLFAPLAARFLPRDPAIRSRVIHRASQAILVVLGLAAFVIALDPPKLLGIFGMVGVYGIVAASAIPILGGIVLPDMSARAAGLSALLGVGIHFGLYALGAHHPELGAEYGLVNPGVCATYGILCSVLPTVPALVRALPASHRRARTSSSSTSCSCAHR